MFSSDTKLGWSVAIIIVLIFVSIVTGNGNKTKTPSTTYKPYKPVEIKTDYTLPKYITTQVVKAEDIVTWHCVDATSYNKNAYDDNKCTSSNGVVRYVSDSQARALDPSYVPGTAGHPYYNSK